MIFHERKKEVNSLQLFFLSRISVKKNLLKVFNYLEKIPNEISITFDIIGTIEDNNYWEKCQQRIKDIRKNHSNIKISFIGPIPNNELQEKIKNYHFLLLPTLHENFGHVMLDALSAGCGLIISDNTPWKNLTQKQVGWNIQLENDTAFVNAICEAAKMNQNIFLTWSKNAFDEAVKYLNDKKNIADNILLFESTC